MPILMQIGLGNLDDRTSPSAYLVFLGHNLISWSSKKQHTVARSSTEVEYRDVATTAAEILWLRSLLFELGISVVSSPPIYCDNVGATYLCDNPIFHSHMKHIAIDFHFVRRYIQDGALCVTHVSVADQLADALAKPIPSKRLQQLCVKIGVVPNSVLRRRIGK